MTRLQVAAIVTVFIVAALFGFWVEVHSALQEVRHTDLADFLRAGWAVRIGNDPYQIVEEHGWHYNFPPLFAIVVAPLADPPRGADNRGMVPFPVSVAIWYVLSLCLLAAASNLVASALEQTVGGDRMRNLRPPWQWWRMRLLPILICIGPIAFTLSRGQVNLLLLFLLCAMIAAVIARQPVRAGLWLAGAVCLKVFPLYLVVYPLWRRDWRFLTGLAGGLAMGLVLIPVAVLGMNRTVLYYSELTRAVFEPALIGGSDRSRASELIDPSATDSQSFQTIIHNVVGWREQFNVKRRLRSNYISPWVRAAHWVIVGILTMLTFAAAGQGQNLHRFTEIALLGALMMVMLLASPVCHMHYFVMALPLVAVLLTVGQADHTGRFGQRVMRLLGGYLVLNLLPLSPRLEILHDLGMGTFAALALWVTGLIVLIRARGGESPLLHCYDNTDPGAAPPSG